MTGSERLLGTVWKGRPVRLVFIEPDGGVLAALRQRVVGHYGVRAMHVRIINAALCNNSATNLSFYAFSKAMRRHFSLHEVGAVHSGLQVRSLLELIGTVDKDALLTDAERFHEAGWTAARPEVVLPFVVEAPARCLAPAAALAEVRLLPEAVDMLFIDCPQASARLLQFLALGAFEPALLRFHAFWGPASSRKSPGQALDSAAAAVDTLSAAGFNTYHSFSFLLAVANQST